MSVPTISDKSLPITTLVNTPVNVPAGSTLSLDKVFLRELSDSETGNLTKRAEEIKHSIKARKSESQSLFNLFSEIQYLP